MGFIFSIKINKNNLIEELSNLDPSIVNTIVIDNFKMIIESNSIVNIYRYSTIDISDESFSFKIYITEFNMKMYYNFFNILIQLQNYSGIEEDEYYSDDNYSDNSF